MAKKKSGSDTKAAARWFAQMLFTSKVDGGEIEMRVFGQANKVKRNYVNDTAQFETVVAGNPDAAVYFGVAIRKAPLKEDSTKANVLGTDMLWAEVDTEKIGWDTDKVLAAVHALPTNLRPSACVHSGYGLHFYWRLTEALHDVKQIEQANQVLRELVSGDNVWDATRILRVPGSNNVKFGKSKKCRVVWCYHWNRLDVSDLLDTAMNHRVLWNGKWISAEKRAAKIEARKQDINDNAYQYAMEDRRKTTNARGLKVWEQTTYHGGPGMYGVDEAVMLFTAYQYCVTSGSLSLKGKRVSEEHMDQIVRMAVDQVRKIQERDAPGERWDWPAEKIAVRKKLDRWAKKWDGGLREQADKAYKEKKEIGEGKHARGREESVGTRSVQRTGRRAGSKVDRPRA